MALSNDLKLGRPRGADITKAMTLAKYTVATLPAAAGHDGRMIWVTNGNAGALHGGVQRHRVAADHPRHGGCRHLTP